MFRRLLQLGKKVFLDGTPQEYVITIHPEGTKEKERFTERSRRVLSRSQAAAEDVHSAVIRSEHLLLGLIREEGGIASHVLTSLGANGEKIEGLIREVVTPPPASAGDVSISDEVRKTLELAVDEARRQNLPFIGTEHLLLAIMRQPNTAAFKVLNRMNITPSEVRDRTLALLAAAAKNPFPPAQDTPPNRNEPFTAGYQRVLKLAREAAEAVKDDTLRTEHMLLGLMREGEGIAGRVLLALIPNPEILENAVRELSKPTTSEGEIQMADDVKEMLKMAVDEAHYRKHATISTEHLLLSIIRQKQTTAFEVLQRLGIQPSDVREKVYEIWDAPTVSQQPSQSHPQEQRDQADDDLSDDVDDRQQPL